MIYISEQNDIALQIQLLPLVRIIFDGKKKSMNYSAILEQASVELACDQSEGILQRDKIPQYIDYVLWKYPGLAIRDYSRFHQFEITEIKKPQRSRKKRKAATVVEPNAQPSPTPAFDLATLNQKIEPHHMAILETLIHAQGEIVHVDELIAVVKPVIGFKTMQDSTLSRVFGVMCDELDHIAPELADRLEESDRGYRLRAA